MQPILIALGANLPSRRWGSPQATLEAALDRLTGHGVAVLKRSRWYRTAPVPVSDQPDFINGVAALRTTLPAQELLTILHQIEAEFGRERGEPNAARVIDLDLLAYGDLVLAGPQAPILPHPRLADRAFVLVPLADVAPGWRHPVTGRTVEAMIGDLPPGQGIHALDPA